MSREETLRSAAAVLDEARMLRQMLQAAEQQLARQEQAWRRVVLSLVEEHEEDDAWRDGMREQIEQMRSALDASRVHHELIAAHVVQAQQEHAGIQTTT